MKAIVASIFLLIFASYFIFFNKKLTFKTNAEVASQPYTASKLEILNAKFSLQDKMVSVNEIMQKGSYSHLVIHFWATWCVPCLKELPLLFKYAQTKSAEQKDIAFIFIAVEDEEKNINNFLKKVNIDKNELGFWLIDQNQETYNVFRVDKIPETYIVRDNNEVTRLVGAQVWK